MPYIFIDDTRPPMPPNRKVVKPLLGLEFMMLEIAETRKAIKEKIAFVETEESFPWDDEKRREIYNNAHKTISALNLLEQSLLFWGGRKNYGEIQP